jgi:hypothetical protein
MASVHSLRAGFRRFRAVVLAGLVILTLTPEPMRAWPQEIGAADGTAPERTVAAGTFARAIAREAVRLAAVQPGGSPAESNWTRVRRIVPGTELTLTVKGSPPGAQRYFVAGDDSDLTVLNVAEPGIPAAARDVLRGVALRHPGDFPAAQQGRQIALGKNVRIGPDGVFVSDRKVADLGQIVETIARDDVGEITTQQMGRGFWGHAGTIGGYFLGAMAGGLSGGFLADLGCQAPVGSDRCSNGAFLTGAVVGEIAGGIAGAAYGFHAEHRKTEVAVYRAPWLVRAGGSAGSE